MKRAKNQRHETNKVQKIEVIQNTTSSQDKLPKYKNRKLTILWTLQQVKINLIFKIKNTKKQMIRLIYV